MNRREKIIAIAVGLFVGGVLLYLLLSAVLLTPLAQRDKRRSVLETAISDLRTKQSQREADKRAVASFAKQTLGGDANAVSEAVSRRLTKMVETSGLAQNMKVDIQSPKIVDGGGKEIACTVGAEGKLSNVCDLLFLLKASPELHRIDNLSIKPRGQDNTVRVDFRYATLVLDTPKGTRAPTTMPSEDLSEVSLNDPNRELYNVVTARNLLARYEPPAPRPFLPPNNMPHSEEPEQPPQPEDWQFKVVALPAWGGAEEIFIRDSSANSTQKYRVGQPLAGGVIAMIDYRPMPRMDRPGLLSPSRLILKLGRDYWAVELGQSLSQKRQMKHSELPTTLQN